MELPVCFYYTRVGLRTDRELIVTAAGEQRMKGASAAAAAVAAATAAAAPAAAAVTPVCVQEISALACCRSPHITSYYASLIPPGSSQLLIVMELLVGSVADVVSVCPGGGGLE
jgi:hypothetical protein